MTEALTPLLIALLTIGGSPAAPDAATNDWPQFRGPRGDGVVQTLRHPLGWSEDRNVGWKVASPGHGWSAPIVVGERVFLASAGGPDQPAPKNMEKGSSTLSSMGLGGRKPGQPVRFELHALDLATGGLLWSRLVTEQAPVLPIHPSNTYATETPAADAQRVFVFFGAVGVLACFDHRGDEVWRRSFDVHPVSSEFGTGASLRLHDGRLFLQQFNDKRSSFWAISATDGKTLWTKELPTKSSWSTPFVWRHGREDLIACGSSAVFALDPATGAARWELNRIPSGFTASPAAANDALYFGASSPFGDAGLYGISTAAQDDITPTKGTDARTGGMLWHQKKAGVGMSSLLAADGLIYVAGEGRLKAFDAGTGELVYKDRLPGGRIVVASPWAGDGRLFLLDEDGRTFVVRTGRTFEVLGVNRLNDTFWASTAVAGDRLLLRGVASLYCIHRAAGD